MGICAAEGCTVMCDPEKLMCLPHWLLLTKRIGNVPQMLEEMFGDDDPLWAGQGIPENVFIGATIVTQEEWNRDIGKIAAASVLVGRKRIFLSMEPLLGPVEFARPRYRWSGIVGWVIVGGESGPGARAMHPDWVEDILHQCENAAVPFMFKQWGEHSVDRIEASDPRSIRYPVGHVIYLKVGKKLAGRKLYGKTYDGVPV